MERTALPRRLAWQQGRVVGIVEETPRCRSLLLDVPDWAGHCAGQHVDIRLTAEDGYQAQRSYSLISSPEVPQITLTVERLDDGEVSPYLTEVLQVGDQWRNSMTSDEQHLDGNAAGGVLAQIFAFEMTTAEVICANCDAVGPLGAAVVYATAMGTIIRCPGCGEALIRIAHGPQRYWVNFSGTRLMQLATPE